MIHAARLRRSTDIETVRSNGRAVRRSAFAMRALSTDHPTARLAVSAPRTLGGAVKRNRARRRLREAFGRALGGGAAFDLLVVARPGAVDAPFPQLVAEVTSALAEAGR